MKERDKPLWSDGVSLDDLTNLDSLLTESTIFQLWEDILCLKEEVKYLKDEKELISKILEGMVDRVEGNVLSSSEMKDRLKVRKETLLEHNLYPHDATGETLNQLADMVSVCTTSSKGE